MKNVYLVGGTMGVGKTTICQQLKRKLPNSVFLDGDWCWDADPFWVTEETKKMVLENICFFKYICYILSVIFIRTYCCGSSSGYTRSTNSCNHEKFPSLSAVHTLSPFVYLQIVTVQYPHSYESKCIPNHLR